MATVEKCNVTDPTGPLTVLAGYLHDWWELHVFKKKGITLNRKVSRNARCLYLKSADKDRKAAVGLKGSHVQIGNEVHDTHRPRHKRDLVLLVPQELDHLETGMFGYKTALMARNMC